MIPNEVFYFATQGNKGIPSITCSSHTGTVPMWGAAHRGTVPRTTPLLPSYGSMPDE